MTKKQFEEITKWQKETFPNAKFTYTHTHGNDGKLVQKMLPIKETLFDKLQYKKYLLTSIAYDTQGFTEADNGKEFGEGEFEVKMQRMNFANDEWEDCDQKLFDAFELMPTKRRIIATPKRSERVFTLGEALQIWADGYNKGVYDMDSHDREPEPDKAEYFKTKFSINLKQ